MVQQVYTGSFFQTRLLLTVRVLNAKAGRHSSLVKEILLFQCSIGVNDAKLSGYGLRLDGIIGNEELRYHRPQIT